MPVILEPVDFVDPRWRSWCSQWPEDLRETCRDFVAKWRRVGICDNDAERAFNAFLTYRSMAPPDLGGPLTRAPEGADTTEADPDWSDL